MSVITNCLSKIRFSDITILKKIFCFGIRNKNLKINSKKHKKNNDKNSKKICFITKLECLQKIVLILFEVVHD